MAKDKRGGHNRKSEQQHLQDKNWRPDRHGLTDAFVPGEPVPQMPLGEHGKQLWAEVLANLPDKAISKADGYKLSMLCSQWDQLQVQMAIWTADPSNRDARLAVNQLTSVIDRLGTQFGLSPKDRQKMPRAGWDKSAEEQDLFAEFMKAGQN
jgi:phage terminase small subunit